MGAQRAACSQEACQVATTLLNLLERVEYGCVIVVQASAEDPRRPVDGGARLRLDGVHERDSVLVLKQRVVEEEPGLGPEGRLQLYVAGTVEQLDDGAECASAGEERLLLLLLPDHPLALAGAPRQVSEEWKFLAASPRETAGACVCLWAPRGVGASCPGARL